MHDVRYALRTLRRYPGYSAVVVITLALALGTITALYSVADVTMLARLPLPRDEQVVSLYDRQPAYAFPANASWPEVKDWRAHARTLQAVAAERTENVSYVGGAEPERLVAAYVSQDYFKVFGVGAARGRLFTA